MTRPSCAREGTSPAEAENAGDADTDLALGPDPDPGPDDACSEGPDVPPSPPSVSG